MISIYEMRGREAGREEGREAGREEGREEGMLIGKREAVLTLMRLKFGAVPPHIETDVRELPTQAELDRLFARVVTAKLFAGSRTGNGLIVRRQRDSRTLAEPGSSRNLRRAVSHKSRIHAPDFLFSGITI